MSRKSIDGKSFIWGGGVGFVLFAVLNFVNINRMSIDHPPSSQISFGFPYKFYFMVFYANNLPNETSILYSFLLRDLVFAMVFSVLTGLFYEVWSKFRSQKLH